MKKNIKDEAALSIVILLKIGQKMKSPIGKSLIINSATLINAALEIEKLENNLASMIDKIYTDVEEIKEKIKGEDNARQHYKTLGTGKID